MAWCVTSSTCFDGPVFTRARNQRFMMLGALANQAAQHPQPVQSVMFRYSDLPAFTSVSTL